MTYRGMMIKLAGGFSSATADARGKWNSILNAEAIPYHIQVNCYFRMKTFNEVK